MNVLWIAAASFAETESVRAESPVFQQESIFARNPKKDHSSSIVSCPDGSLLVAWFHGFGECECDHVVILGARKAAAADSWSKPFVLADTPGHPDCNPVLWIDQRERLWLFYSTIVANDWGSALIKYRVSTDYTDASRPPVWQRSEVIHVKPPKFREEVFRQSDEFAATLKSLPRNLRIEWDETPFKEIWPPFAMVAGGVLLVMWWAWRSVKRKGPDRRFRRWIIKLEVYFGATLLIGSAALGIWCYLHIGNTVHQRLGWLTAHPPVRLDDGRVVLPLYSDRFVCSMMVYSDDDGDTWHAGRPLIGYGNIQPTLAQRSSGELVALMRDNGTRKHIRIATSGDRGESWSSVDELPLPNANAKVCVRVLTNGNWVLAYNDTYDGRHRFSVALSEDEGRTWRYSRRIAQGRKGLARFSYPSLIQTSDGLIHLTYTDSSRGTAGSTIQHVTLNDAWIKDGG